MGEVARTFGLGGPPKQTAAPLPYMDGDPVSSSSRMIGAPSNAPSYASPSAAPMSAPTADDWKPHHQTLLGTLADTFLLGLGVPMETFGHKVKQQNMQEALQGFEQDPIKAIDRMRQVNPAAAWKMYNEYTDNQRMQGTLDRQNRSQDMRNDDYVFQQTGGMMMAANESNWSQMRDIAIKRAAARGVDVSNLIPEAYDPDSVKFITMGAVKPKDQMKMNETNRHNVTREGQMQQGINERGRHDQVTEGISSGRASETARHNQATEGQQATNEAGRNNRSKNAKPVVVNTPNGPMELDKSGTRGRIGDTLWQKTAPGQWKRVK